MGLIPITIALFQNETFTQNINLKRLIGHVNFVFDSPAAFFALLILAIEESKVVILVGACAISGGIFQHFEELNREFGDKYKIDLYIPSCSVHPLTIIKAILDFLGQ